MGPRTLLGLGVSREARVKAMASLVLGATTLLVAVAAAPATASSMVVSDADRGPEARSSNKLFAPPLRWKGRVIPYHNKARVYATEVREAARAWNRSGARVRWKAVPAGRARVTISVSPRAGSGGLAYGIDGRSGRIYLSPQLKRASRSALGRSTIRSVAAHEMGHIMGLNHEDRRCANMNSVVRLRCRSPKEPWRYRCRLLELDDVRGAVRIFGGRPRRPSKTHCDVVGPPPAVRGLTAAPAGDGSIRIEWRKPDQAKTLTVLRGSGGACPAHPGPTGAHPGAVSIDGPGITRTAGLAIDREAPLGKGCYGVFSYGKLGRPGKAAFVTVTDLGSAPVAAFESFCCIERTADFEDRSDDPDEQRGGGIVGRSWSFGDGTGSTEHSPSHTYAAPGQYQVTLVVTDATGQTGSTTQTITVEEDPPPEPEPEP